MPAIPRLEGGLVHTLEGNFVDSNGRTLLLRGVNLSGSSKAPVHQPSQVLDGFWEDGKSGEYSFIGRPLDLDDGSADVHLARLKGWGFNMLRYPVTWEALEHAGPGKYDYAFMDYTVRVLRKCKEYGFKVFMDPHQDVWSRFTGGSGAPYWTLEACGIDSSSLTKTHSAMIHCEYPSPESPDPASFPAMIWSTNYGRLASQTLFTMFFAGRDFAPKCTINGRNIQDYLQGHFIAAFGALADRIRDAGDLFDECVIGWDSMNEPFEGLCRYPDVTKDPPEQRGIFKKGTYPTPIQSLRMGMGIPQTLDNWSFGGFGPQRDGSVTADPQGARLWADPSTEVDGVHPKWGWRRDPGWKLGTCIWAQHGVWDVDTAEAILLHYFQRLPHAPDTDVDFIPEYWLPHFTAYAARIRESHPNAILFVNPPVFAIPPPIDEEVLQGRACYSPHYYDGLTLVTRHWNWFNADALGVQRGKYSSPVFAVKVGEAAIRKSIQEQLGVLKADVDVLSTARRYPTLIGEIGIPYDMDGKRSYGWTDGGKYEGDYGRQQKAFDASLNAADGPNALNYTIWTYCPDSSHSWGDGWNLEDLSLWSADDLRGDSDDDDVKTRLRKMRTPRNLSMATSTLSLRTAVTRLASDKRQPTSLDRWDNALDFLTDGARAVRAFVRPYPVSTIGVPTEFHFDISKAEFNLSVRVSAEDALVPSSNYEDDDKLELATEIYVPLVHYANDALLSNFTHPEQASPDTAFRDSVAVAGDISGVTASTAAVPTALPTALALPSAIISSEATLPLLPNTPLDLVVKVSEGRWEIEGQILKWYYPVPPAHDESKERTYTIQIRRAKGPIKVFEEGLEGEGLCEVVTESLPDSCVVA